MMEKAASVLGEGARALVFSQEGYASKGTDVYEADHFSLLMKAWLSSPGVYVVNFVQVRGLWITCWSDYIDQAELTPEDGAAQLLKDAASVLVGNSTVAWERNYDARARSRAFDRIHFHYPKFIVFVREQHARAQAIVPRNPITGGT